MDSRKRAILRHAPTLVVAACAVMLGIRTSWEGDSLVRKTAEAPATLPAGAFKSPYRELRERQAAARLPTVRMPVIVSGADETPITLKDARHFLAENRNFQRASTRAKSDATVIRRLCASGFTDEAFASIETERSGARDAGISAFFLSARLDDRSTLEKVRIFKESDDAITALRAYLKRLPLDSLALLPVEDEALKPAIREALTAHFREKLGDAGERDDALALIETFHAKGLLEDDLVARKILSETTDAFAKWDQINRRIANPGTETSRTLWEVVEKMAEQDPVRAIDAVFTQDATHRSNIPFLRPALARLAEKDPAAAHRWYEEHEKKLTPAQRDDAAWIFAARALESDLPDQVAYWKGQVKDPQTQERLARVLNARNFPAAPH